MSSKTTATMVALSEVWESLSEILHDFLSELLETMIAPVNVSAALSPKVRADERYDITQTVDDTVPAVWVESELAGTIGECIFAYCESPKMIGDPDSQFPENHEPMVFDALWFKMGSNPFSPDGEQEDAIIITVIGKGPRYVRTDRVIGEVVNFLASPDAEAEYEWVLEEEALAFETVGFAPCRLTAAANFSSPERFLSALQSQVRQTRKAAPDGVGRDFSDIEQDRAAAQIARYRRA